MANVLALALVLVAIAAGGNKGIIIMVEAQLASPPASPSSCSASLASLAPCINFLVGPSTPSTSVSPTQSCCSAVTSVANNSAICLCPLFTSGGSSYLLGFPVNNIPLPLNQTRALNLPGACRVSSPLLSQCKLSAARGAGAPVATPVSSPVAAPLSATSSPSPAVTSKAMSPASSVVSPALPPATTGGVLPPATTGGVLPPSKAPVTSTALPPTATTTGGVHSPSGSHVKPTGSSGAGSMMSFTMSSVLIVGLGLINIIVSIV